MLVLPRPKFALIQYGARHNYAIPEALNKAGALAIVFTDLVGSKGVGRLVAQSIGAYLPRVAQSLRRREPPVALMKHVYAFGGIFLLKEGLRKFAGNSSFLAKMSDIASATIERRMIAIGYSDATHVYTMLGEGGRFVEFAQAKGLKIVSDVYIALSADAIVQAERLRFPDWGETADPDALLPANTIMLSTTDIFLCPSDFVRDDLIENFAIDPAKTVVIPYAVSDRWISLRATPEPGRILFAGTANLRKGIHYFAFASQLLNPAKVRCLVAGGVADAVRRHRDTTALTFLGHLAAQDLAAEFEKADVVVLPSLAEGAASVTAEALGAGIPVVTTKAAGSIVRHGIDGLIVPERDPHALAQAIRQIVDDRDLRARMSAAARERAKAFTWDTYAAAVIAAAATIPGSGTQGFAA